jgi:formylglycine-generating enzyme required for sulfatase activity
MLVLLLLPALTEAQQAVPCPRPLSEAQLTQLVKGSVPATRIRQLVASCGIDFEPTGEVIGRLHFAGMPEAVLSAVRAATGPAERKLKAEQALWESIKDSDALAVVGDFLRQYPEGQFAAPARQKYRALKIAGVSVKVEQALRDEQWDEAERLIRELLPVGPDDEAIMRWQNRIANGREILRLKKELAAKSVVPPGTKKVNPMDGLTYVWIPPGTFQMGCSPGDGECYDDEKPAHQVTITKGFWLGQTPVTQQAYQRVTGQNPSGFQGPNFPVGGVNLDESRAYCVAVGGRLPTEAEWEYAARAGSTGARYGNLDQIAWYSENSGGKTHEVGQKPPNDFGLYGMLGNVWQRVADWYGNYHPGAQSDPAGAENGESRALRGGSWNSNPRIARVSYRSRYSAGSRDHYVGLRCVGESDAAPSAADAPAAPTAAVLLNSIMASSNKVNPKDSLSTVHNSSTSKVNPKDGLTYIWIPPGAFRMGCSPEDGECDDDEKPAHQVTVTKGFWLGQTPVTQQAYQRVTGKNPSSFKGANLPVETVNWDEARAYCAAIGGRLPTEAEWEYAARAGSTGARYGYPDRIAWYSENSGGKTHEVGQKLSTAFGLYDMLGNVWQWAADSFGHYPSGAQSDPNGALISQQRVRRGGSWHDGPRSARVSSRDWDGPGFRDNYIGLRCVGELDAPPIAAAASASPTSAVLPKGLMAGSKKVNAKDGLTYVWIPPGKFKMGCSHGDSACDGDEKPAHEVAITRGFWMGQTPVTQQAYERVRGENPSNFKGANLPVETVNWDEAHAYCAAVGGRLPTEAEWEYVARARSTGVRYGSLDEIAWYLGNSGGKTHEVGQKLPNAFGLYDMLGNVWQWVLDWDEEYQSGKQIDPFRPTRPTVPTRGQVFIGRPTSTLLRVVRGNAWNGQPKDVRVSFRNMSRPSARYSNVGLRCVEE